MAMVIALAKTMRIMLERKLRQNLVIRIVVLRGRQLENLMVRMSGQCLGHQIERKLKSVLTWDLTKEQDNSR
jgi:hypothetical protein